MLAFADELLKILSKYFIYLYPGFIFLWIYRFLKGLNFKETKESIIKSIVISFILVEFWLPFLDAILNLTINKWFKNVNASATGVKHFVLMVSAILLPYLIWKLRDAKWFKSVLEFSGIGSNLRDNPLDIADHYEHGPRVMAIMDDYGVMYDGYLRNYNNDLENGEYIMISGYSISKLNKESNTYEQTYPYPDVADKEKKKKKQDKEKRDKGRQVEHTEQEVDKNDVPEENKGQTGSTEWVVLSRKNITRLEILFDKPH